MRRLAKNALQAQPEGALYPSTLGVASHPGLHTADDRLVAAPYAQMRFENSGMKDYPVIVELDMTGLTALPDYDAEEMVLPTMRDIVRYNVTDPNDVAGSLDELMGFAEDGGVERDGTPDTAIEALHWAHPSVSDPSYALASALQQRPEESARRNLLALARGGNVDQDLLTEVTGQFRYLDDVGEDRVVAVYYMRPFWPELLEEGAHDDYIEAAMAAGFDVADRYEPVTHVHAALAYEGAPGGERPEYHGTSLLTVRKALPGIELPDPPDLDTGFASR